VKVPAHNRANEARDEALRHVRDARFFAQVEDPARAAECYKRAAVSFKTAEHRYRRAVLQYRALAVFFAVLALLILVDALGRL